jgi:hypothetical protein
MGKALEDARVGLEKAQRDVSQWKGAIAVIRRKINAGAPWPEQLDGRKSGQQHSV